jgi:hypothetical protein
MMNGRLRRGAVAPCCAGAMVAIRSFLPLR